jgi:hypothetical protein
MEDRSGWGQGPLELHRAGEDVTVGKGRVVVIICLVLLGVSLLAAWWLFSVRIMDLFGSAADLLSHKH